MHLLQKSAALLALMLFAQPVAQGGQSPVAWYSSWPMDIVCDAVPLRVKRYRSPPPIPEQVLEYLVGDNVFLFELQRENAPERMVFSRASDARRSTESEDENLLRLMEMYLHKASVLRPELVIKVCLTEMEHLNVAAPSPRLTEEARMRALTEELHAHRDGKPYQLLPDVPEPML